MKSITTLEWEYHKQQLLKNAAYTSTLLFLEDNLSFEDFVNSLYKYKEDYINSKEVIREYV